MTDEYSLFSYGLRKAAEATVGVKPVNNRPQWQIDNSEQLRDLSSRKQEAYRARFDTPEGMDHFKSVSAHCKRRVRDILNQWWDQQAHTIQQATEQNHPEHPYVGLRVLRQTLGHGRRAPTKLRKKQGELIQQQTQ